MADVIPLLGGAGGGTNIAALIQALLPTLIGTGTTSRNETGTTTQGSAIDPGINALLQQLLSGVQAGNSGYTKDQAILDSNNIIQGMVKTAIDQNLPSVLSGGQGAGLYNDSTRTLLNNDLQARIAAQAAQQVQQNINNYAQITQGNNNTAAQIGGVLAQGNRTQTNTTNNSTSQTTSPAVGGSARNNIAAGLGGTIGLSALKQLPWDKLLGLGGTGAAALGSGEVFSGGLASAVNPGNLLNAGYGFDNGLGGLAPSFGADLNLGGVTGNLGQVVNSQYDFSSMFGNAGNTISDAASGIGSAISSGASDLGSGIGDLAGGAWDWLGDAASGASDWFSSFFANGGRVPTSQELRASHDKYQEQSKGNYANGGRVARGRQGGEAYTADAVSRPIYDPTMAMWEQILAPSTDSLSGSETTTTPEQQAGGAAPTSEAVLNYIRNQVETAQARPVPGPTGVDTAKSAVSGIRSGTKLADTISTNETAISAAGAASNLAAADLGGAAAALSGGISGGAGALGSTVGAVDTLGAITGGTGFLPAYTGTATGIFGGAGTGAAAGTGALTGTAGASSAAAGGAAAEGVAGGAGAAGGAGGAAAGAGVVAAPLVVKALIDRFFGGVSERFQSDVESWQKLSDSIKTRGGVSPDTWAAGFGFLDPFFNPNAPGNEGLTPAQMQANLVQYLSTGQYANTGANTGNAAIPYVADVGQYIADNYGQVSQQANQGSQAIQDFWNNPDNPAIGSNGGLSLANGGAVPGAAKDPKGSKDNIPINVSGGEYIVPKDVVDTLGEDFFDNLVSLHHQPIAGKAPTR